jgi:hypothetical protein
MRRGAMPEVSHDVEHRPQPLTPFPADRSPWPPGARPGVALLLLLAGLLFVSGSARADWREFLGAWRLDRQTGVIADSSVDRAADNIFFLVRGRARSRLHQNLDPAEGFTLEGIADTVYLGWNDHRYFILPDRSTFTLEDEREGHVECRDHWAPGVLENFRGVEDGSLYRRFELEPDGQALLLSLTIVSPKLRFPARVHYRYVRVN